MPWSDLIPLLIALTFLVSLFTWAVRTARSEFRPSCNKPPSLVSRALDKLGMLLCGLAAAAIMLGLLVSGCYMLFLAGAVVFEQVTTWLQSGVWVPRPASLYASPGSSYIGVNKIISWFLSWPVALYMALVGLVSAGLAVFLLVGVEEPSRG